MVKPRVIYRCLRYTKKTNLKIMKKVKVKNCVFSQV
jgi:hypothetical protein